MKLNISPNPKKNTHTQCAQATERLAHTPAAPYIYENTNASHVTNTNWRFTMITQLSHILLVSHHTDLIFFSLHGDFHHVTFYQQISAVYETVFDVLKRADAYPLLAQSFIEFGDVFLSLFCR